MKSIIDRLLNKPEWQDPDPAVRADAVLRIPSTESETLLAIALDDSEPRVRRAATRKLHDPEALANLASDADEGVREEAAARLVHIAAHAAEESSGMAAVGALEEPRHLATVVRTAHSPAVREAALDSLSDPRALAAVVREAEDPAIRLSALERIEDQPTLLALAVKTPLKAVAVAAVDRLDNHESLARVAAEARAAAAARRARSRLERHEGTTDAPTEDSPKSLSDEDAREREAYERARAEQEKEAAERAQALADREALCERLERAEGESIPSSLQDVRAAWAALPETTGEQAVHLARRFEASVESAEKRHEAFLSGAARRDELTALVTEAEELVAGSNHERTAWSSLERRWESLAASADQPDLRERFEAAVSTHRERQRASREEREKRNRENLARLTSLAERAESLLEKPEVRLREMDHVSRDIKAALEQPGHFPTREDRERTLARLDTARKALYPRLKELREDAEWQRWANVDVQEELCARAEALLEEEDPEAVARRLRDLDARWKQAREAPKEKAEHLWARFKKARDAVKERVDEHFARQAEELASNLEKKEALCEKAEALAESTDWARTADALRAFQAEWKTIGPVPRSRSRKLWERFRKPCDRFFTRWQQHRAEREEGWAENLQKKEALCEKAEALMDSTDWETTASELKKLQSEWRTIGAVKKSRSDAIWKRFRKACDQFFERYKHRDTLALQGVRTARETICVDLEALDAGGNDDDAAPEDLVARVQAAQTAWRQAGELPRDMMEPLDRRFATACERLVERYPEAFSGTELDPEASRRKAEKLVARVEGILEGLAPRGGVETIETSEELAARLRDALAANTIGGREAEEARWHSAGSDVEAAQAAWRRLGPVPGPEGKALAARFEAACGEFHEKRPRVEPRPERPRARKRRPRRPA